MDILENTALIHAESFEYPLYLRHLRRRISRASLPRVPTLAHVRSFGYYPVMSTEKPKGDVVTEIDPEKVDGVYHQRWVARDFTQEEKDARLRERKKYLQAKANALRDKEIIEGVKYTFPNGEEETIPLKQADQTILVTQRVMATEVLRLQIDQMFVYRTLENNIHSLTAQQVVDMTGFVVQYYEDLLRNSWVYKDGVMACEIFDDLPEPPATFRPEAEGGAS